MKETELHEQSALIEWAQRMEPARPELAMLFAIPNGGLRNIRVAVKLKRSGVKAGIPDLFLAVPRGPWAGLFIEMKAGSGKPTSAQQTWLAALRSQGYRAEVCVGFEGARRTIRDYLGAESDA